jgi:hypothetical protein
MTKSNSPIFFGLIPTSGASSVTNANDASMIVIDEALTAGPLYFPRHSIEQKPVILIDLTSVRVLQDPIIGKFDPLPAIILEFIIVI